MPFASEQTNAYVAFDCDLRRDSFRGEQVPVNPASSSYASVEDAIAALAEFKDEAGGRLSCLLSLSTVEDDKKRYADWVSIPTQRVGVTTRYATDTLIQYFEYHRYRAVPDPLRNFDNLDFMTTRVLAYKALSDRAKSLIVTDLDRESKKVITNAMVQGWIDGNLDCKKELVLFLGLTSFTDNLFVFSGIDFTVAGTKLTNAGAVPGSFLIRESAQNAGDGRGHATVFTITYIKSDGESWNIRFMALHGVGVYQLTGACGQYAFDLTGTVCMQTFLITDILTELRKGWRVYPNYSSIGDMLHFLHEQTIIDLSKILLPDNTDIAVEI